MVHDLNQTACVLREGTLVKAQAVIRSEGLVVARVVSEDVVELDIIDLVGSLGLETSLNDVELLLRHLHFEVVEDGTESGERNEAAAALVLILEVWLDQKASVFDVSAEALEHGDKDSFLLVVEHILRVQDRRGIEATG